MQCLDNDFDSIENLARPMQAVTFSLGTWAAARRLQEQERQRRLASLNAVDDDTAAVDPWSAPIETTTSTPSVAAATKTKRGSLTNGKSGDAKQRSGSSAGVAPEATPAPVVSTATLAAFGGISQWDNTLDPDEEEVAVHSHLRQESSAILASSRAARMRQSRGADQGRHAAYRQERESIFGSADCFGGSRNDGGATSGTAAPPRKAQVLLAAQDDFNNPSASREEVHGSEDKKHAGTEDEGDSSPGILLSQPTLPADFDQPQTVEPKVVHSRDASPAATPKAALRGAVVGSGDISGPVAVGSGSMLAALKRLSANDTAGLHIDWSRNRCPHNDSPSRFRLAASPSQSFKRSALRTSSFTTSDGLLTPPQRPSVPPSADLTSVDSPVGRTPTGGDAAGGASVKRATSGAKMGRTVSFAGPLATTDAALRQQLQTSASKLSINAKDTEQQHHVPVGRKLPRATFRTQDDPSLVVTNHSGRLRGPMALLHPIRGVDRVNYEELYRDQFTAARELLEMDQNYMSAIENLDYHMASVQFTFNKMLQGSFMQNAESKKAELDQRRKLLVRDYRTPGGAADGTGPTAAASTAGPGDAKEAGGPATLNPLQRLAMASPMLLRTKPA